MHEGGDSPLCCLTGRIAFQKVGRSAHLSTLLMFFAPQAGEWAALARDVNSVAAKLITLKSCYPNADVFKIAAARPRLLLQSDQELVEGASKVRVPSAMSVLRCRGC